MDEVEKIVGDIVANHMGIDRGQVGPDSRLALDLGADELDITELSSEFELQFWVKLPDLSFAQIGAASIRDIGTLITEALESGNVRRRPRRHHYRFVYQTLPKLVFDDFEEFIAQVRAADAAGEDYFLEVWKLVGALTEKSRVGAADKFSLEFVSPEGLEHTLHTLSSGAILVLVTLPPPLTMPEAFYCAIVGTSGPTDDVRYFTWELGEQRTILGEWLTNGERRRHTYSGESSLSPSIDTFVKALEEVLSTTLHPQASVAGQSARIDASAEYREGCVWIANAKNDEEFVRGLQHLVRAQELGAKEFETEYVGWYVLSDYYVESGELSKAREACTRVLDSDSIGSDTIASVYHTLATIDLQEGNLENAIRHADMALESRELGPDEEYDLLIIKAESYRQLVIDHHENDQGLHSDSEIDAFIDKAVSTIREVVNRTDDPADRKDKLAVIDGLSKLRKSRKGCFIATSVYENRRAPQVVYLQDYRDRVLVRSSLGRGCTRAYYFLSPGVAEIIGRSALLKGILRVFLLEPLVRVLRAVYGEAPGIHTGEQPSIERSSDDTKKVPANSTQSMKLSGDTR